MLVGCTEQAKEATQNIDMPRFSDVDLAKGRSHWMGTCRNCHLLGTSGAPAVTDHAAWEPRIAKGKAALYKSALDGIRDQDEVIRMPPMGGNPRLSDKQVRLAVDYMVSAVEYLYRQKLDRQKRLRLAESGFRNRQGSHRAHKGMESIMKKINYNSTEMVSQS